jgi:hypothetical protein
MKDRPRIGQISITVNGECCPVGESKSTEFAFTQRTFELEPGNAKGIRGITQHPSVEEVYAAAVTFLEEFGKKLGIERVE